MQDVYLFIIDGSPVAVKLLGTIGFVARIPTSLNRHNIFRRVRAALSSNLPINVAILAAFRACE